MDLAFGTDLLVPINETSRPADTFRGLSLVASQHPNPNACVPQRLERRFNSCTAHV